jgi:hypothetical protein
MQVIDEYDEQSEVADRLRIKVTDQIIISDWNNRSIDRSSEFLLWWIDLIIAQMVCELIR